MSEDKHSVDTITPINQNSRILGNFSYLMLWLGGCVSIGNFAVGSGLVTGGANSLNFLQAATAIILGQLIVTIFLVINDKFSYVTGAPYVVQLRMAFGIKGTVIPAFARAIPAIVWYGFQSWVGGSALNEISTIFFGFNSPFLFFLAFHAFQVVLSISGFKGIKWVENIGSVIIIVSLAYMLYIAMSQYSDVLTEKLINIKGSWGLKFWGATTSFLGLNAAVLLNAGDYVRQLKPGTSPIKRGFIYATSLIPANLFMGLIGITMATATGISNPVVAFSQTIENKFLVIITLLFIIFAQITTNLLNNALPPIYVLMDTFKLKHKSASIIVGIVALFTFPWKLIQPNSAAGLNIFILVYSAFLAPILGILIVDYYVLRKKKIDLDELYKENGLFAGVNKQALLSILIGGAASFMMIQISWMIGFVVGSAVYFILMKMASKTNPFVKGTIFEKGK